MESNLNEALLAGINLPASSSPSASVPDDDISKTDGTPPRLSPPPPPPPPSQRVDMGKNRTSTSYSPSVGNANMAKNSASPPQSSPPGASDSGERSSESTDAPADPSTSASRPPGSDTDEHSCDRTKLPGGRDPPTLPSGALGSNHGLQDDMTAPGNSPRTTLLTSPRSSSSPPTSRSWFGLRRRLLRLPVSAPPPPPPPPPPAGRRFNWFHQWKETNRPKAPRLDSVGVEKVIGVYGFSLFGSISLLPSTMDRIKEQNLTDDQKTYLLMAFGCIWVLGSFGVHCGLYGKTDFEQGVCRHTGRLGMLGLVLLVILHLRWALPVGTNYDRFFYVFAGLATVLHLVSWGASFIVGDDRMEDAAPVEGEP